MCWGWLQAVPHATRTTSELSHATTTTMKIRQHVGQTVSLFTKYAYKTLVTRNTYACRDRPNHLRSLFFVKPCWPLNEEMCLFPLFHGNVTAVSYIRKSLWLSKSLEDTGAAGWKRPLRELGCRRSSTNQYLWSQSMPKGTKNHEPLHISKQWMQNMQLKTLVHEFGPKVNHSTRWCWQNGFSLGKLWVLWNIEQSLASGIWEFNVEMYNFW